MSDPAGKTAWLLLAAGEDREHGGNTGYDDQPDVYYSWDSTVAHHRDLAVGDPIALWDKQRLLGVSVIEEIETSTQEKLLLRCPNCGMAGVKQRKRMSPRYKCYKCSHLFDEPVTRLAPVTQYRSRHDAGWRNLEDVLSGAELRLLCLSIKSQQSLRPLRWDDFRAAVQDRGHEQALGIVDRRALTPIAQGHTLATVRVRRGQEAFRHRLLDQQGERCAFTGSAPQSVLEAGHLYSYAALGVHHNHGGLMLRRDIHRLFDDGGLAVTPTDLRVDVADSLEPYPQYASLHGLPLRVPIGPSQAEWLGEHWEEHRRGRASGSKQAGKLDLTWPRDS